MNTVESVRHMRFACLLFGLALLGYGCSGRQSEPGAAPTLDEFLSDLEVRDTADGERVHGQAVHDISWRNGGNSDTKLQLVYWYGPLEVSISESGRVLKVERLAELADHTGDGREIPTPN